MKIQTILTGGTFLSVPQANGRLAPVQDLDEFNRKITPELVRPFQGDLSFDFTFPFLVDSSEVNLGHLNRLAAEIHKGLLSDASGLLIVTGTDTMEEIASAMRFRYLGPRPGDNLLNKPVVFTGAMRSVFESGSDAVQNFQDSVEALRWALANKLGDIMIAFGRQLMPGIRAAKGDPSEYRSFRAPAFEYEANDRFHSLGLSAHAERFMRSSPWATSNPPAEQTSSGVVVITVKPQLSSEQLSAMLRLEQVSTIVLALPGDGNLAPHLLPALEVARELDKPVVAISKSDGKPVTLENYATGSAGKALGLIAGLDLTSAAAVAKSDYLDRIWPLSGVKSRLEFYRTSMALSFCGECTPHTFPSGRPA